MPLQERVCVECGKRFTLLPNKPGLVNMCPQCVAPVPVDAPERKPRKRRQKTVNEIVSDNERKRWRHQKLMEVIYPKGKRS